MYTHSCHLFLESNLLTESRMWQNAHHRGDRGTMGHGAHWVTAILTLLYTACGRFLSFHFLLLDHRMYCWLGLLKEVASCLTK